MTLPDPQLSYSLRLAFKPPAPILPSEYAEQTIILPPSNNAMPGPLKLAKHQIEMADSLVADGIEVVAMMCAAQTGKTTVIECMLASIIGNDQGPTLMVHPSRDLYEDYVERRINPMIDNAPTLRALVGKGGLTRRGHSGGIDNLQKKTFPGGWLKMASSHIAGDMAGLTCRFVIMDEVDRFLESVAREGNPVDLAYKRADLFEGKGRRVVLASTPRARFNSRINEWFLKGDQRKLFCTCTQCGDSFPMHHSDLRWPDGKPEEAYHVCPGCGKPSDELARLKMLKAAEWRPTATPIDKTVRSYHMPQLASQFATMAEVARQFAAATTPTARVAFHNLCAAEVYDAGVDIELSAQDLQERAEDIGEPYPAALQYVVAGVDVQADRVEASLVGFGPKGPKGEDPEAWVLDHLVLRGDEHLSKWQKLETALARTFKTADGRELPVQVTAVDGGEFTDAVLKFVEDQREKYNRQRRRFFVTKGQGEKFGGLWRKEGAKIRGARYLSPITWQMVGTWEVKLEIAQRLMLQNVGPGYVHFPSHLDATYFDGICAEQLITVTLKSGVTQLRWKRIYRFNEPIDCLCYAFAISTLAKPHLTRPAPAAPTSPSTPAKTPMQIALEKQAKLQAALN